MIAEHCLKESTPETSHNPPQVMSTHTGSISEPILLHFQDHVRVAGEVIQGRVDLNVALAQKDGIEHLRIKFRGSIETYVVSSFGRRR
jgi:hypothetical protein